jgi:hypothetical protein
MRFPATARGEDGWSHEPRDGTGLIVFGIVMGVVAAIMAFKGVPRGRNDEAGQGQGQ